MTKDTKRSPGHGKSRLSRHKYIHSKKHLSYCIAKEEQDNITNTTASLKTKDAFQVRSWGVVVVDTRHLTPPNATRRLGSVRNVSLINRRGHRLSITLQTERVPLSPHTLFLYVKAT
ncbi:hypothetical protein E2C01_083134 [Portunus trituberculatus]|uniref:Uncharacterized protein n=1 Tax=Portunus trituberculatus TaxID=210409 RepID=A0A5B7J6Z7_PORTR|nr:hypothetical protein [Portunus trituberculatus]